MSSRQWLFAAATMTAAGWAFVGYMGFPSTGATVRQDDVNGVPLADVEQVDGPPVLLVHVTDDAKLHAALLSWAVTLSGLPAPERPPRVQRMPHEFFVRNVCGNRECQVLGWFPPGETVYLDDRLDPERNLLAASIVVHEMVHFLQFKAAHTAVDYSCARSMELERQAYGVQREFITRYGVYHPVGASMHQVGCDGP